MSYKLVIPGNAIKNKTAILYNIGGIIVLDKVKEIFKLELE
ncbi:MAG: hypothetical protein ACK5MZ_05580 [Aestuariibaculum sp.]